MMDDSRAPGAPLWRWITEIGMDKIDESAVAGLLRQRRQVVINCLEALLQQGASASERNAAASAIGTLTELEKKLKAENR